MSQELVKRAQQSLVPVGEEWLAYKQISEVWSQAQGMLPAHINTPQKALATMLAARDLGLKITAAFKGLYVTNGKIQMEAWAALGLVQGRIKTFDYEILQNTDAVAEVRGRRNEHQTWKHGYYDIKMALQAGLLDKKGDVWSKNPSDMLFSKALMRMLRKTASDVLMGLAYDEEEMEQIGTPAPATLSGIEKEDIVDISGAEEIKDAEIVNESNGGDNVQDK